MEPATLLEAFKSHPGGLRGLALAVGVSRSRLYRVAAGRYCSLDLAMAIVAALEDPAQNLDWFLAERRREQNRRRRAALKRA